MTDIYLLRNNPNNSYKYMDINVRISTLSILYNNNDIININFNTICRSIMLFDLVLEKINDEINDVLTILTGCITTAHAYEENKCLSFNETYRLLSNSNKCGNFNKLEIMNIESKILETLNCYISYDSLYEYFYRHDKKLNNKTRHVSLYFITLFLIYGYYMFFNDKQELVEEIIYICDYLTGDTSYDYMYRQNIIYELICAIHTNYTIDINIFNIFVYDEDNNDRYFETIIDAKNIENGLILNEIIDDIWIDSIKKYDQNHIPSYTYINIFTDINNGNNSERKSLGGGTYGEVMKVQINDDEYHAVKKYRSAEKHNYFISSDNIREINSLLVLCHTNIIDIYGCVFGKGTVDLHMELMDNNLYDHIVNNVTIPYCTRKKYISDILNGLEYMHSMFIIHRDLTPDNILITDNCIKIGDFGFSRKMTSELDMNTFSNNTGTNMYQPIELYFGATKYNYGIDIWSTGCVIYFILMGDDLFDYESFYDIISNMYKFLGTPMLTDYPDLYSLPLSIYNPVYVEGNDAKFKNVQQKYPIYTEMICEMLSYDYLNRIKSCDIINTYKDRLKNSE
jgi:Protein kinase domain/Cyclin, N-terminal domain